MIGLKQVWFMDSNGFYTGITKLVKEIPENSTTVPLIESYIKPKFNGIKWIEGATEEEMLNYDYVEVRTLQELQDIKQEKNKLKLAEHLASHPVLWIDGNYYGITFDDQVEMSLDLNVYNLKQSMGFTDWKLEWHNIKKSCREFELEEFLGLLNLITNTVFPYRSYCESVKESIYNCTTKEELDAIEIDYNSVTIETEEESKEDDSTDVITNDTTDQTEENGVQDKEDAQENEPVSSENTES